MKKEDIIPLEDLKKINKPINANIRSKEDLTLLDKVAVFITKIVGTMWCAIIFTIIALLGLPGAIEGGRYEVITWLTQTFLQLVLFSVVIVGQNLQNRHAQKRADFNFDVNVKSELEIETILQHLENQNKVLLDIQKKIGDK